MKKQLLYFCLLLMPAFMFAQQDTIVVQTLTWESDTRSQTFTFPDPSEGPFEKIIMLYNMRCHDNQVGNGNVGCREWDYSCNTFITTPEIQDSTFRTHPTHTISNYDDDTYAYSNTPIYTYYQFDQYETVYNSTISENTAQVGSDAASFDLANTSSTKKQFLFTATELSDAGLNAGDISGLRLFVNNATGNLNFMRIRMKHSAQTALDAATPELDGFSQVYFQSTNLSTDWHNFNFYENFDWDGSSNVLVEMTYYHASADAAVELAASTTTEASSLSSLDSEHVMEFDGSSVVRLASEPLQNNISDEITVSFWAKGDVDALPKGTYAFNGLDENGNRQVSAHLPWSNSRIYWDCGYEGGYDRIEKVATPEEFEGKWQHWVFTKNANTGNMRIYLNGEVWHSGTGKTNLINVSQFGLGSTPTGSNKYIGQMSEFRVFNKELDAATINEWMRKSVDNTHPNYDNLIAYYPLNEGDGNALQDHSSYAQEAEVSGTIAWKELRATEYFKNFETQNTRPNTVFVQGQYDQTTTTNTVLDSTLNSKNQIIIFEVNDQNDLVAVDTIYHWEGAGSYVYDEDGNIINVFDEPIDGTIDIGELNYFEKKDAKLEILSLVTPYGNGLSLGAEGKTFTFDVTDFMPILHGDLRLSVELGGEWQEELDIRFLFIKGTPARDILSIENVWPFRRGNYGDIQDDNVFEPRNMRLHEDGEVFKLRSSVTGHGQNGEFVARNHYLRVDNNTPMTYQVWKACGFNPIYPQGGTWVFDRAGWCPGMATDVHEFDITPNVNAGGTTLVDYGVNGAHLDQANYLVSTQLVTYGGPNFTNDAAVEDIIRPSKKVEYERINPACNGPVVRIKNTGANTLTSLEIAYSVEGGGSESYTWTGSLEFMETEEVELPMDDYHFWDTNQEDKVFVVSISNPNGSADEYTNNNEMTSEFEPAIIFESSEMLLRTRTNNSASQNSYVIKDYAGNVVMERSNMSNNTNYEDEINLVDGCYTLEFTDTGNNGLDFWFQAGEGTGSLSFRRWLTETVSAGVKSFDPDFGAGIQYDFIVPTYVSNENLETAQRFSVFPNPAREQVSIELMGYENQELTVQLLDMTGRVLKTQTIDHQFEVQAHNFNLPKVAAGMYLLKVQGKDKTTTREIVIY